MSKDTGYVNGQSSPETHVRHFQEIIAETQSGYGVEARPGGNQGLGLKPSQGAGLRAVFFSSIREEINDPNLKTVRAMVVSDSRKLEIVGITQINAIFDGRRMSFMEKLIDSHFCRSDWNEVDSSIGGYRRCLIHEETKIGIYFNTSHDRKENRRLATKHLLIIHETALWSLGFERQICFMKKILESGLKITSIHLKFRDHKPHIPFTRLIELTGVMDKKNAVSKHVRGFRVGSYCNSWNEEYDTRVGTIYLGGKESEKRMIIYEALGKRGIDSIDYELRLNGNYCKAFIDKIRSNLFELDNPDLLIAKEHVIDEFKRSFGLYELDEKGRQTDTPINEWLSILNGFFCNPISGNGKTISYVEGNNKSMRNVPLIWEEFD